MEELEQNSTSYMSLDTLTSSFTADSGVSNIVGVANQYVTSTPPNYLTATQYNGTISPSTALTNEERIDSILSAINLLVVKIDKLRKAATELVDEMKVEKHERRTLTKTKE